MRYLITLLILSISLAAYSADYVYKRTNPDGTVDYSDKPLEGGEVIKVPKGSTFSSSPVVRQSSSTSGGDAEPEKVSYKLVITEPEDDQAVRSNNGSITFRASLSPGNLPIGYRIVWSIDEVAIPGYSGLFANMKNVDRGTHELQVNIVDGKGNNITSSDVISFHMLRVSGG